MRLNGDGIDKGFYIGFIFWYFASSIIAEISITISSEKQMGTLEQLLVKPINLQDILLVRMVVLNMVSLIKICIILVLIKCTLPIEIVINLKTLAVLIISFIGFTGLGYILAAFTVIYTKTASFESVLSYILLFLSGGIINIDRLPKWLQIIGNTLPLNAGVELSRSLILSSPITYEDWFKTFLINIIYFIIGYFVFGIVLSKSKIKGINNSY
jgi:ABC-2 type transport system permease protein